MGGWALGAPGTQPGELGRAYHAMRRLCHRSGPRGALTLVVNLAIMGLLDLWRLYTDLRLHSSPTTLETRAGVSGASRATR